MIFLHFLLAASVLVCAHAQDTTAASSTTAVLPIYLSLAPNINRFDRFANGGSDESWYIGFNNAWIVKLPPAPLGDFAHVFIGAKIGRAKTRPNPKKPWLRELIDGNVYMAISQTPSFSFEQESFLASAGDLPVEPDPQTYVEGVGEAQWFWHEVPMASVSFTRPNYLIIWSRSSYFTRASSSPILAAVSAEEAGIGSETRAWNNHSIMGVPPRSPGSSLETPLNSIYPALAIKLVPPNDGEVSVSGLSVTRSGKSGLVEFSAGGDDIIEAWVESSRDQLDWTPISKVRREPPYFFTLGPDKFPTPGNYLRGAARDADGNVGTSEIYPIPYGSR